MDSGRIKSVITEENSELFRLHRKKYATGEIKYAGITSRNPIVRFGEHLRSKTNRATLEYRVIHQNLTRMQARKIEQSYINRLGLQKNGGKLYNKINSTRKGR